MIYDQLIAEGNSDNPAVKLLYAVEPDQVTNAERIAEAREHGVRVFSDYKDLLATEVEAIWLPVPIDLHRRFTEMAVAAGKAVMCEKPAAGSVDDVDAMMAARDRAKVPVAIGFQHIYDPAISEVKRRILRGDIGKILSVTLHACWPRDERYYLRNNWAGKYKRGDTWVLDSPANNALAHFINLGLYFLGSKPSESAVPLSIETELYRAKPIETYDTVAMRLHLPGGATLLALLTHACRQTVDPVVEITGERGSVRFVNMRALELSAEDTIEPFSVTPHLHVNMIRRFASCVRYGDTHDIASLECARAQTVAVNGASQAVAVRNVDKQSIDPASYSIRGIEQLFTQCAEAGQLPHESGQAKWTAPAGKLDLRNYSHFTGPI
jgi:predicted dehydrogenase